MRQNMKNKGFTLVELLIVVAIIGILAAVLTPQFLNARKVAADRAAEAYAHNVYTAVQAHIADTGSEDLTTLTDCHVPGWGASTKYAVPAAGANLKIDKCIVADDGTSMGLKYQGGSTSPDYVTINGFDEADLD